MSMSTTSDDHTAETFYSDEEAFFRNMQNCRVSVYDQIVCIPFTSGPKNKPTATPQAEQHIPATEKGGEKK